MEIQMNPTMWTIVLLRFRNAGDVVNEAACEVDGGGLYLTTGLSQVYLSWRMCEGFRESSREETLLTPVQTQEKKSSCFFVRERWCHYSCTGDFTGRVRLMYRCVRELL
ncbi:hypothetical protein EYF80_060258 [Liparis tanakae]|uniref:Uncharacterized protein n=1 Tax=Liparis tanakae TaxID=230148 RepID=A0A4Z2EMJ8_9TELE|nr:hypothetical protein EYF80_060258 [Liparis tanakae]